MSQFENVKRSPHVVAAQRGNDTVLMDLARGSYFSLDEVGGRVWDLLSVATNAESIVTILAEEYDAPADRISKDLEELLGRLDEAHLLG